MKQGDKGNQTYEDVKSPHEFPLQVACDPKPKA
jgi:hypothetical protein